MIRDINFDSLPIHDESTGRDHRVPGTTTDEIILVTGGTQHHRLAPTAVVRLPYEDFLNFEHTGLSEIRALPCYNRTTTKQFAY